MTNQVAKSTTQRAGRTNKAKAAKFSVAEWRGNVEAAALDYATAGVRLLALILEARKAKVDPDAARETVHHAFAAAYASLNGLEFEAALKAPSVRNRVSEAMAVFNCEELPDSLPNNIQHAASACRAAKRGARQTTGPKADKPAKAAKAEGIKASPLALLQLALDGLKAECGENRAALELVAELQDLAADLVQAMKGEAGDVIEGEVVAA